MAASMLKAYNSQHVSIFYKRIVSLVYFISIIPLLVAGRDCSLKTSKNIMYHLASESKFSKFGLCSKPIDFKKWEFDENNLLLQSFPIEVETRNFCRQVRRALFSYVLPISLKSKLTLIAVSSRVLESILDIDSNSIEGSQEFLEFVSGNGLVMNSFPLAHRYGGHQFGEWSGQLGDGRAVMLGDYVNSKGERWELQLKGSGKTPFSRQGDGRAVLRSSIREFLASEAMYHLGIPTSRAAR